MQERWKLVAGAAFLLAALLVLWLFSGSREEPRPQPVASTEAPRPSTPHPVPERMELEEPVGEEPVAGELMVSWCHDEATPKELFVSLGYIDDARVERIELPERCAVPGTTERSCVYKGLQPGRYLAIQGPFAQTGRLSGSEATTLELDCSAACGAQVVVHPEESCAEQGTFSLLVGWEGGNRGELANVEWHADQPFVLTDLACQPSAYVELRADGCEPRVEPVALQEALGQWSFALRPEGDLMVRVLDAVTLEPISGVSLIVVGRPKLGTSDAEGWIGPYAQERGDPQPFVHKSGYLQRDVWYSCFDEDDVCVLHLHRPEIVDVRCEDNGSPCPDDTRMFILDNKGKARGRRCRRVDEWTWTCETVEDDRARACVKQRCSDREALVRDGEDIVYLPPFDGEICLQWPTDAIGPCTLSSGEAWDAAELPCDSCGVDTAVNGQPVAVPARPGTIAQVTLHCPDAAWSGETIVDSFGKAPCEEIPLLPHGMICAHGLGRCRAHSKRAELRLSPTFNGCSEQVPSGAWSVACDGVWYDVEVGPGETVDVQGVGQTLEERLAR